MIPYASQIKKTAKEIFSKNSFYCIATSCILIFSFLMSYILFEVLGYVTNYYVSSAVFILLIVFVCFPLLLGVLRCYRRLMYGECDNPINVFYYFSDIQCYFSSINYILSLMCRIVVIAGFVFLPSILLRLASIPKLYNILGIDIPLFTPLFSTISSYLAVISFFVFLVFILKYYLSPFLFVSSDCLDNKQTIKTSVVIAKRTKLDYVYLIFNMFIYILASFFVVPIPLTLPIIISAYVLHSIYAIKQYNETIDSINEQRDEQL